MEVPDSSQRDVVPVGDWIKGFVLGGHILGIKYLGTEVVLDDDDEMRGKRLKAANHEYSNTGVVQADKWNYVRMAWCFPGVGESLRVGDEINVRGIEFSAFLSLTSLVKGTMLPNGSGGFLTEAIGNGPMLMRIVILIRPRGDGNSSAYTWSSAFQYDEIESPIGLTPLEEGVVCLYDRTAVLDDDGDAWYDKVWVDCDFLQAFHEEEINPWMNDIEVWYYFNEPSYGGNAMSFKLRTWYLDN